LSSAPVTRCRISRWCSTGLEQLLQLGIRADHARRRLEAVVRDLARRREDQQLGRVAPVADQRRQHDAGGDRRLAFFLLISSRNSRISRLPAIRVVGAEDRADEVEDPVVARLAERRVRAVGLGRQVDDLQRLEHRERGAASSGNSGATRHQAAPSTIRCSQSGQAVVHSGRAAI
jgi:hypothetical protein